MLARQVLKNVLYSSSSTLVANLTGLVTVIFLARALKPELFGLYSLSISTVAIVSVFTDLGIRSAATRYIADAMKLEDYGLAGGYARFLINLKLLLTVLVASALFFLSDFLANVFNKPISDLLRLLSLYLFFTSFNSLLLGMANAMNDFKADFLNSSVSSISKLFLTVLLVILGFSLFGAVIAVVISSIVTFFFILNYALRKYRFLFSSKVRVDTDRIVRFILFTALLSVPATIYANVDMVMIGYFLSSEDVAYYRAGFSIVGAVLGLISVPTVLMPVFVKLEGEDLSRAFARAFKYSSALCIPSAFGLGLISQNLLIFAYGDEYLPGLLALQALSVLLISPAFGIYGSVFSGRERPDLYFYPVMVSMILNVILNYLLIPILGIAGAAIATVLSHIFYWFVLAYIGLREFELRPQLGYIAKPLLCAILMFLVARNFNSMLLTVPLSIVIYSAALLAVRGITREDIDFIRKIGGV